jgi:O-antigen/teichoic acid export membrane protein
MTIVLIFVLTSIFGVGPVAISICYTISAAVTAVISWAWTRRSIPHGQGSGAGAVTESAGVKMAMLHMMGSSVLFFVLTSSPLFVLGIFATAREVGYYNAAARLSTLIALIPALQTTYLIPRLARHLTERDLARANAVLRRAVRQAALLSVAVAIVMLTFAGHIVAIFGNDFSAATPTLIVLVIGQVVIITLGNVNPIMAIAGLERRSLLLVILVLALGVIPMLGAASVMGAVGVAMVYVLMSVAYALTCDVLLRNKVGIKCFVN